MSYSKWVLLGGWRKDSRGSDTWVGPLGLGSRKGSVMDLGSADLFK